MTRTKATIIFSEESYDQADMESMIREALSKLPALNVESVEITYEHNNDQDTKEEERSAFWNRYTGEN